MDPQRRIEIYVGFDSPSIIKFLEPLNGDVFKARFEDYHFDENNFTSLGEANSMLEAREEITWNNPKLSHFDPRTNQYDLKVQRIIYLQNTANHRMLSPVVKR